MTIFFLYCIDAFVVVFVSIVRNGHNGEQCIKRALCETAQLEYYEHHAENVPDSFAKEILRTVFR